MVEPVAGGEYVVVYFHTKTQRDNIPSYWWIKQIYNTLPYKYKKNLKVRSIQGFDLNRPYVLGLFRSKAKPLNEEAL